MSLDAEIAVAVVEAQDALQRYELYRDGDCPIEARKALEDLQTKFARCDALFALKRQQEAN